jgi:hypothetical protein
LNTEYVVYLLRKTNLTRSDIGKLTPAQFNAILSETYFQESQEEWRRQHSVASILAAIYNTIPRKKGSRPIKSSDFLQGEMPSRIPKESTIDDLADKYKVSLPTQELKARQ